MRKKECAKNWQVKPEIVEKYCNEWMVPGASPIYDKFNKIIDWEIPDESQKPPVHGTVAIELMENIDLVSNENANPLFSGISYKNILEAYVLFEDRGFITGFDDEGIDCENKKSFKKILNERLKETKITSRGYEFIDKHNHPEKYVNDGKRYFDSVEAEASAEIDAGPVKASAKVKAKR